MSSLSQEAGSLYDALVEGGSKPAVLQVALVMMVMILVVITVVMMMVMMVILVILIMDYD